MSVGRSDDQEPRPQVHKIVLDVDDWDVPKTEDGSEVHKRRVTLKIDGAKLGRAILDAANKHDRTKTYANGAFTVEVSK